MELLTFWLICSIVVAVIAGSQDIPIGYLEWIIKQDFDRDTMFTARHFLKVHGRR